MPNFSPKARKRSVILSQYAMTQHTTAAACCVIAYWDKITDLFRALGEKLGFEVEVHKDSEFDDYADWETDSL